MLNSSVSIAVSDEEPDEPSGRLRVRVHRKRKKPGPRARPDFTRKFISKLLRWWPAVVLLFAVVLLIYEALKIGRVPDTDPHWLRNPGNVTHRSSNNSRGNLNRLDPTTRIVGGARQRCLSLLPSEELELLDLPKDADYGNPVKKLIYITEIDRTNKEEKSNLSLGYLEGTRFNLFTGNQTLEQREQSFKVTETPEVHCGFYSENGGFRISDEDKSYMDTCKAVVSTCAFGGGDDLYQPIGMSETSLQKVCYVAFWDEITLATQESEGKKINENHFIGKWRVIVVRHLPFRDQRLNGKIPKDRTGKMTRPGHFLNIPEMTVIEFTHHRKMLPHRLFPNAKFSIWVDSKSQLRRDPLGVWETLLWRSNYELAISEHGARSSVYDEAKAVVKKNKATPEEVEVQLTQYRQDRLPEDKRFDGKKALAEASIIVRKHTPATNLFMCLWFNEVVSFTSRDQLSFPYVLWRLKGLLKINLFPVCTRKDLVNSMGHIRKAKPLTN